MRWLRTIIRLWKGDDFREILRQSKETREEARQVLDHTKETLDGECDWIWGPKYEKTTSDRR